MNSRRYENPCRIYIHAVLPNMPGTVMALTVEPGRPGRKPMKSFFSMSSMT